MKGVKQVWGDLALNKAFDDSSSKGAEGLLKPAVLQRMWNEAGLYEPLHPLPLLVFWDVRSSTPTPFPAGTDAQNVVLMAGDSDSPFQAFH